MKGTLAFALFLSMLGCLLWLCSRQEPEAAPEVGWVGAPVVLLDTPISELRVALEGIPRLKHRHAATGLADLVERLVGTPFDRWQEADRALLLDQLRSVLELDRHLGEPRRRACASAARVLGHLGPRGAALLKQAYLQENFAEREDIGLRALFLLELGRTRDGSMITFLMREVGRGHWPALNAAAGEALANFAHLPLAERRPIVKEMIQRMEYVFADATSSANPNDPRAALGRREWSAIFGPWNSTLAALTRQGTNVPGDWGAWWTAHGGEDWDAGGGGR